ncbi:hypothetical protein OMO38_20030 [Chryseobacterium sp. 09-1422]|uniref:Uncharacterized protein n=1 Tax=Chryseobacterium kimseyorum TaxID=2984028 RepID=A0ABT3I419_9FLAO|nr:hypothetical protein [Chryseobacterium kimseyorum]MCW3170826.1 hypothetical protein [Chryseobacterium kimseyorum]
MKYNIRTSCEGLIIIHPSKILKICRPNSIEGTKSLGAPVIINVDHICLVSFNREGNPCYFLSNGFEVAINLPIDVVSKAFENAKCKKDSEFVSEPIEH